VPAVFFAAMFGFKERPYFAASAAAQTAPEVKFDFSGKKP
jgi:LemA protein